MSTDTDGPGDGDGDRMEKIDVRVPAAVLETVDEEYARRGYASRSEAIRDAIRDWLNPSPQLSEEMLVDLEESRKQRERGETVSAAEARERLGLSDVDEE
ncbi:ribbon-helix-helix protein, CopG family [Halogeometricum sp. S1BR25-6]|uniref:Ribbon-helix-helix protein, CopG family n=1 Tax=Halogeometricum salsisoli TaxID=2950536 RepID=A0ABU2GKK1_9EURY|nr:ribbon-helix-helix protein, CopG family [Halogeometricum sp. S1BR25-6]MDS0301352.1 ribbon-helix-helix protein, CopG family [Halogeometricum sp. S1BR25-6]